MKGKGKKEEVDFSTLPKANIFVSTLMLDFKNPETKYKIFETFYKNGTNDPLVHFITREHIIDYAKEAKIYIDPTEGKKQQPKDAPPIEKKDITAEELAKACLGLINERSIPPRKEKKVIIDKIAELTKQKEESEEYYKSVQNTEKSVESTKNKKDKKKPEVKKPKNDKAPPKPEEIIIPEFNDDKVEMIAIFYNYPINDVEYKALCEVTNEFNDNLSINLVSLYIDIDEYIEPVVEVVYDKKGKPIQSKEAKLTQEQILMQKYFTQPNLPLVITQTLSEKDVDDPQSNVPTEKNLNRMTISEIYAKMKEMKCESDIHSLMRQSVFESENFTLKNMNDTPENIISDLYTKYSEKLMLYATMMISYKKWKKEIKGIKLYDQINEISIRDIISMNSGVPITRESIGRILFAFLADHLRKERLDPRNKLAYELLNNDDMIFAISKRFGYEYHTKGEKCDENESHDNIYEPLSHVAILNEKEHERIDCEMNKCDINSTPFKAIINYSDIICQKCFDEKIRGKFVCLLEKSLNVFRTHPQIENCLREYYMFSHLEYQKGINNEIIPFALKQNISRHLLDRFYFIKSFENLIREKVPERSIDLSEWKYCEVLPSDIFKQKINEILLFDYESASLYDKRSGKTLVAFYYRCPKGRVYRKRKEYRYLSRPDFDNWIKYFAPKFKKVELEKDTNVAEKDKKKEKNVMNETRRIGFKFEIDTTEDNSNNNQPSDDRLKSTQQLYEGDDIKIGEVNERIKYMFPCDNGILVKKVIECGIFSTAISYIRKDDLVFGIKQSDDSSNEFWLNFSPELKMSVLYKDDYDPFFKNNEEPIESSNGCSITFTQVNGLTIQIMPNGEICQKKFAGNSILDTNNSNFERLDMQEEHYRVIASKGSVIKYYPLETKILYSSGNCCSIINNLATNVNNKGNRMARSVIDETEVSERESIAISSHFDPESNTNTISREDNVIVIDYPDKSKFVIHGDDTRIYTSPTVNEITRYVIEHDSYATVEVTYDQVKKRTMTTIASGSTEALMGADNLMIRSYDGRLSKIILPDGTLIYTYKEKKATEEFETYSFNTVTVIYRLDGTVVRITQDGDIVVITSNERKKLNDKGMQKDFENLKDTDYLFEMNGKPDERKGGVYTADMKKGKIWTRDDETNIFEIHSNGDAKCKVQGTTIKEMNEKTIDEIIPDSPRYTTRDYINPETRFSDTPSNFYPPLLFILDNSDQSAIELLCEKQIENFKRDMRKSNLTCKYISREILNDESIEHLWINEQTDFEARLKKTQEISNSIRLPQKYHKISQSTINTIYPTKKEYIVRKIKEYKPITKEIRDLVEKAEKELKDTKSQIFVKKTVDSIDKSIMNMNRDIQRRFIMERMRKTCE